ncbi:MAG: hypothetical protein ACK5B3_05810 [Bacteroidota bacterium]
MKFLEQLVDSEGNNLLITAWNNLVFDSVLWIKVIHKKVVLC